MNSDIVIIRNSDKVAVYKAPYAFNEKGTWLTADSVDQNINTSNAIAVRMLREPEYFETGLFKFDDTINRFVVTKEGEPTVLAKIKEDIIAGINKETAQKIVKGFDYPLSFDGQAEEVYHFSYDEKDQINFTDSALKAQSMQSSGERSTSSYLEYKGYRKIAEEDYSSEATTINFTASQFLELYDAGLAHKYKLLNSAIEAKKAVYAIGSYNDALAFKRIAEAGE